MAFGRLASAFFREPKEQNRILCFGQTPDFLGRAKISRSRFRQARSERVKGIEPSCQQGKLSFYH